MSHSLMSLVQAYSHDLEQSDQENARRAEKRELVERLVRENEKYLEARIVYWSTMFPHCDMDFRVTKALYIAAYTFDDHKDCTFRYWWDRKIRGSYSNYKLKLKRWKADQWMSRFAPDNCIPMDDALESAVYPRNEQIPIEMRDAISRLQAGDRFLIYKYYYMGFTDLQISDGLCTKQNVCHARLRAVARLKKIYEK